MIQAGSDAFAKRLLDEAVLAAVEADDADPSAGTQTVGGQTQQLLQAAQLVVDQDAKGLEGAGGRVEQAIVSGLEEYLEAEAPVVDAWIRGSG
mgnify:CR=1 FL=1